MIGFIASEYHYTLQYIGQLSPFQIEFLIQWKLWAANQQSEQRK
jgi:hypothetical protein